VLIRGDGVEPEGWPRSVFVGDSDLGGGVPEVNDTRRGDAAGRIVTGGG